ncbi:MAG TPA: type VI secretion system membrane subunit TssM [Vicinamibacterales bacterium]|jgi:type VI secretion system protein ImpL
MFAFLKSRAFLTLIGFILLFLFIWYVGPFFGFADRYPLESITGRLIVMALVVAIWVVSIVLKRTRANRASDQLVAAVVMQSKADERPSAEALQLRERFEEAVATLKGKRKSGHSLYELPWYVIVGAPGSGKTTALVNSGLNFPLEQRTGKGSLRGVGGTRNCDWWFTDEAVFLDTAGRYLTQDSDAASDSAGWTEFLSLLRKYRKRRPINGVILTISAQDLMVQGHSGREAYVAAARRRLNELNKELQIQLPVYVMVTKCDLVAGFAEYFDDFEKEGRAQVWGVTFPYEQTTSGKAPQAFGAEFDALMTRLNERVFTRLEEDRDVRRRARIFAFPQQMAALRDLLNGFVTDVFASTRFDQQILLRGVYLTSGTQEGTPIDRLLGALGRRFSVAADAVAPGGRGKAYFIEHLLKGVLLQESGLAGINRRLEVQKAAGQLGAYAGMVAVAVLGLIVFTVSYNRNRTYIDAVAADIATLQKGPRIPVGTAIDLTTLLPRLDALAAVADSANRHRDNVPWSMRWGLYQGGALGDAARAAYSRELNGALLPTLTGRIQQRLVDYAAEPEKVYLYLKAYLMLNLPEHLDKDHLKYMADQEWQTAYATNPKAVDALTKHFSNLLAYNSSLRKMPIDRALVDQARRTIPAESIPRLVYSFIKVSYSADTQNALRFDSLGMEQVFRRKSGTSLSQPMPSLFTAKTFNQVVDRRADEMQKQFDDDRWVWGESSNPMKAAGLKAQVLALYEKEYIQAWDAFLGDLGVASLNGTEDLKRALRALGGPTSPLRSLLKVVDDNTLLVKQQAAGAPASTLSTAQDALKKILATGQKIVGVPASTPGLEVTQHFAPVHALLAGDPGTAPIDRIVQQIREIQDKLQTVGSGIGEQQGDTQTLSSVSRMSESLKQDAASLPQTVGTLVAEVGSRTQALTRSGLRASLADQYRQDVVRECSAAVLGRYPFTAGSTTDVPINDFGRIFGYSGVFDTFYKQNLDRLVDNSKTPWQWRADASGEAVGLGAGVLSQFEQAQRIREAFFRSGAQTPQLDFTLTLTNLKQLASRVVLELDGQSFTYQFGPLRATPAKWPGPNPGVAALTFEERGGGRPHVEFKGPWALFRLVDSGQIRAGESSEKSVLAFQNGQHGTDVIIDALSVHNPFGNRSWQRFSCGG